MQLVREYALELLMLGFMLSTISDERASHLVCSVTAAAIKSNDLLMLLIVILNTFLSVMLSIGIDMLCVLHKLSMMPCRILK